MFGPIHICIDTETWGKRPGFDARSIGACVFSPRTGYIPTERGSENTECTFYTALDNKLHGSYSPAHYSQRDLDQLDWRTGAVRNYQLMRDPDTVKWWYEQSAESQAAFANPVDLKLGLTKFSSWLWSLGVDPKKDDSARIWGHGAGFDAPIVETWFHAVGLPVPWHYRAGRDTRTAFDMVGITDHKKLLEGLRIGVAHHALDDAITEAHAIREAWNRAYQFIPHL